MAYGYKPRDPVGRIAGLPRVENADVISRVRAAERVSGAAAIEPRRPPERSFSAALERNGRGLVSSEPLPSPELRRPLPPPPVSREEDELRLPERLPDTFLGMLWWKVKVRL
jgi:hypothetical protein